MLQRKDFEISVHPRLRGELSNERRVSTNLGGSSPLTRGTPSSIESQYFDFRFIPAYAGNSIGREKRHEF